MANKPTLEQIDAVHLSTDGVSMKLMAFAGAGKTTVLQLIANAFDTRGKQGLYLAFNKAIAVEAKNKMSKNVQCSSFHSLAYRNSPKWLTARIGSDPMNGQAYADYHGLEPIKVTFFEKTKLSMSKKLVTRDFSIWQQKKAIDVGLTNFMKTTAITPSKRHLKSAIKESFSDIETRSLDKIVDALLSTMTAIWLDYINENGKLGFGYNHDIYLKAWALSKPKIKADFILFDEAQDANPIFIDILSHQDTQVIYVGDSAQQIYAWRGATNVMQNLDLPVRYLTKSFRFSQELAEYCQPILNYLGESKKIRGRDDFVTVIDETEKLPSNISVVLTRTNIGAIEVMLDYAETGKTVIPVNVDLRKSIAMIDSLHKFKEDPGSQWKHPILKNFASFDELLEYNNEYIGDQDVAPFLKLYQKHNYKYIKAMLIKCSQKDVACDFEVTTAHKAKGCEWDSVLIHSDFNQQFFDDRGDFKDADNEEYRLLYVALTRAKKHLYTSRIIDVMKLISKYK